MRSKGSEPLISVVIPVFDRERTVGRAIESVLAQTRPPAEIVVVDDGSTDGTAEAVARYGDRVRYLFQPNAGASAARNHGVARATAPWVAFLDSDDHWMRDHLDRMAAAITATGGSAGFYFADCRRPSAEGTASLWELSGFAVPDDHLLVADATDWVLMDLQPTMLQSSVFRRDRFVAVGGLWPELRTRHDTHLYCVLGIGGPACAVARGGVQMTSDDDSGQRLTEEFGPATADWWRQTRLMYTDLLERFPRLATEHRRGLRARLAAAHTQLGEDAWRAGRAGPAAAHLLRAARVAPVRVAAGALRRIGRTARARPGRALPDRGLRTGEAVG